MHKLEGMVWFLTMEKQKQSPAAFLGPEIAAEKVPKNHSQSKTATKKCGKIFLEVFKGISTRNKRFLGKLFRKLSHQKKGGT